MLVGMYDSPYSDPDLNPYDGPDVDTAIRMGNFVCQPEELEGREGRVLRRTLRRATRRVIRATRRRARPPGIALTGRASWGPLDPPKPFAWEPSALFADATAFLGTHG